jgi:hypothetical protein
MIGRDFFFVRPLRSSRARRNCNIPAARGISETGELIFLKFLIRCELKFAKTGRDVGFGFFKNFHDFESQTVGLGDPRIRASQ